MSDHQHYLLRLIPPRPTFPFDMDEREQALMAEHAAYTRVHFEAGRIIVYGPVLDANLPYGVAVLDVADEAEARAVGEQDPTVLAGLHTFDVSPMRVAAIRP
ncbi:MAG: hypothetical protein JWN67_2607 [Actinomycetia bacterium]|nr:hypothetical protein [Actinomycetes bacterium]